MPYDVWLADEKLTDEVVDWCAAHGVRMSSREGVAEYHNASWPRRTKCKEGNLAFFYDNWGYRDYDVVAQLDADHVPEPDYLRRMVAPFADPRVGYVAAPSICDRNAESSWSARGRLYAEAVLHGSTQAGCNAGYAPSCIGSHYAVRTAGARAGRRSRPRARRGLLHHADPQRARVARGVRDRRRGARQRPGLRGRLRHAGLPVGAQHDARAADGHPAVLEGPQPPREGQARRLSALVPAAHRRDAGHGAAARVGAAHA